MSIADGDCDSKFVMPTEHNETANANADARAVDIFCINAYGYANARRVAGCLLVDVRLWR